GTVLAQHPKIKIIVMPSIGLKFIFVFGSILLTVIYRDYDTVVPKLGQSIRYEKQPENITNQQSVYLLSEFNHRIDWIRLNPYSKVSAEQIMQGEQMVLSYPTKYNLLKYAKLLAFNGKEKEAQQQLNRLKIIQK